MKHKQLNKQIKSRDSMTKVRSGKHPGIGAVCLQLEHTGTGAAVGQAQAGSGDVPFARGVGRRQGEQCVRQRIWEGTCRAGSSEEESRASRIQDWRSCFLRNPVRLYLCTLRIGTFEWPV